MKIKVGDRKLGIGGIILRVLIPIFIIIAFIIFSSILKGMKKEPEIKKRKSPILAVLATPAVSDTVQLTVTVQGETRPRTEIDLVPEVAGKIVYVSPKFLTGGLFNKGDVLYRIDPADYKVAIIKSNAAIARAQQVLIREQAEGDIALQDWQDLGQGQASDLTLRKPQLLEAQANLQSAQADLENARLRLARTDVKAPFDGRVREKLADLGQYINPGSKLGRIFSTDVAEIRLALSDADLSRLNLPIAFVAKSRASAPKVHFSTIIGGKLREWDGHIMRTASTYDTQTRSLFAIAEVVDPYGKGAATGGYPLAPGLFVDAQIAGKTMENIIVIPRDGLRPENKIYVVNKDGIAESRNAGVLDVNPNRAVIASGLSVGELVILSPLEKSQISLRFKALDVNDPSKVLVEPKVEKKEDDKKEVLTGKELRTQQANEKQKLKKKHKMELIKAKKQMAEAKKGKSKKGKSKKSNSKEASTAGAK
ncbi:MAG: efflux RND transporter periplasmic adaptor subunit [Robiginitomaculum sp.]|nr:efflux RND transporter periplasmic adaptor subunit [Robiginitomaculum sp.]